LEVKMVANEATRIGNVGGSEGTLDWTLEFVSGRGEGEVHFGQVAAVLTQRTNFVSSGLS
jgi:hypothetical protein